MEETLDDNYVVTYDGSYDYNSELFDSTNSYETETSDDNDLDLDYAAETGAVAAVLGFGLGMILIAMAAAIFVLVAKWKIFVKAGRPGWAAIIPIYSNWVQFEFLNMPGWFSLVSLIPLVGSIAAIVISIIACYRMAKAFGKETAFCIGLIFLPIVFFPILGFGKSDYLGKEAAGNELFK